MNTQILWGVYAVTSGFPFLLYNRKVIWRCTLGAILVDYFAMRAVGVPISQIWLPLVYGGIWFMLMKLGGRLFMGVTPLDITPVVTLLSRGRTMRPHGFKTEVEGMPVPTVDRPMGSPEKRGYNRVV